MPQSEHNAAFIVIEGLDGAGGTTQCRLLKSWLEQEGRSVILTNEPTDLPVGNFIRQVLQDPHSTVDDAALAYLFGADRQNHIKQRVQPAIEVGTTVISDRYYHSSLAYQSLSLDFDFVAKLNAPFPIPNLTFFLLLEPEVSFNRVCERGQPAERFETLDKLRAIAQAYQKVIEYSVERGEHIVCLDATQSIDEIHEQIVQHIQALFTNT